MNKFIIALFALATSIAAEASVVRNVEMNFQSGANFSGDVTFADDFSSVLGVDGVLTGYQGNTTGYVGSGSTTINWIWANGLDFAAGANVYGTFLMDNGTTFGNYANWIAFTYDFSDINNLVFSGDVYGNMIDYQDPMVDGNIGGTSVPEPTPLFLLGLGLLAAALPRSLKKA